MLKFNPVRDRVRNDIFTKYSVEIGRKEFELLNPLRVKGTLYWRHNDHDGVSNHQPHGCLLNRLFRRRSKTTSKLRVTDLCVGNSQGPVNSPHKGQLRGKCFHLMTSSWLHGSYMDGSFEEILRFYYTSLIRQSRRQNFWRNSAEILSECQCNFVKITWQFMHGTFDVGGNGNKTQCILPKKSASWSYISIQVCIEVL